MASWGGQAPGNRPGGVLGALGASAALRSTSRAHRRAACTAIAGKCPSTCLRLAVAPPGATVRYCTMNRALPRRANPHAETGQGLVLQDVALALRRRIGDGACGQAAPCAARRGACLRASRRPPDVRATGSRIESLGNRFCDTNDATRRPVPQPAGHSLAQVENEPFPAKFLCFNRIYSSWPEPILGVRSSITGDSRCTLNAVIPLMGGNPPADHRCAQRPGPEHLREAVDSNPMRYPSPPARARAGYCGIGVSMAPYRIHPDMRDLLAAKAAKPANQDLAVQRAGHDTYGAALAREYPPGMQVEDRALACPGAGAMARCRGGSTVPPAPKRRRPASCTSTAAAFVLGSLDSGDQIASGIAQEVGAVVVSVDYRLAPEIPSPPRRKTATPRSPVCPETPPNSESIPSESRSGVTAPAETSAWRPACSPATGADRGSRPRR